MDEIVEPITKESPKEIIITTEQYYADVNDSGEIIGFYVNTIHGDNIPETAQPITVEEWKLYSSNANLYKFDNEVIREKTPEEIDAEYVEPEPIPKTPEQVSIDQIGSQLVQRELESLELCSQNEVLGGQIVERELEAVDLKAQNEALGGQIVGLELRVLTLEIKPEGVDGNV